MILCAKWKVLSVTVSVPLLRHWSKHQEERRCRLLSSVCRAALWAEAPGVWPTDRHPSVRAHPLPWLGWRCLWALCAPLPAALRCPAASWPPNRLNSEVTLEADWIISSPSLVSSVQFSHSVVSDSLWPCGLQPTRPPCPSPTTGACSNSCPSSQWCHRAISFSLDPFSSHLQSF